MLPYIGAKTNTAAALTMLNQVVFTTASGARDSGDAQRAAILIVNGQSTVNPSQVKYLPVTQSTAVTRLSTSVSLAFALVRCFFIVSPIRILNISGCFEIRPLGLSGRSYSSINKLCQMAFR